MGKGKWGRVAWAATLMLAARTASAEDWSPLWATATLSQPRYQIGASSAGDLAVFAGGRNDTGTGVTAVVDIYNASTNTWSTASLSQARAGIQGASAGNKIVLGGGYNALTGTAGLPVKHVVDVFNVATGMWSTTSLPNLAVDHAATSAGGKVFFGGGAAGTPVDVYDPAGNTWTTMFLSEGRTLAGMTSWGSKVYVAGGIKTAGPFAYSSKVETYDTASGIWSSHDLGFSNARARIAAVAVNGKVLLAGGDDSAPGSTNVMNVLDTATNTWTSTGFPAIGLGLGAATTGTKALFGGTANGVDIYDTATNTWSSAPLSVPRSGVSATAVGSNKILLAGGFVVTQVGSNFVNTPHNTVDIYTAQNYQTITSSKVFALVDDTTVAGRVQLNAPGTLALGTAIKSFSLTAGSLSGSQPINLRSGKVTIGSDNTSTTYTGAISGAAASSATTLTKTGTGTLTLTNPAFTGKTIVNQGKLQINGIVPSTAITVDGGASLGIKGSSASSVTLSGGSAPSSRGTLDLVDGSIGTMTLSNALASFTALSIGGANVADASELDFEIGSAGADNITINAGKLVVNPGGGIINIVPLAGLTDGTYDLINFNAGQASGLQNLRLGNTTVDGFTFSLQTTATAQQLVVSTPEPGGVLGVACAALVGLRRRRVR